MSARPSLAGRVPPPQWPVAALVWAKPRAPPRGRDDAREGKQLILLYRTGLCFCGIYISVDVCAPSCCPAWLVALPLRLSLSFSLSLSRSRSLSHCAKPLLMTDVDITMIYRPVNSGRVGAHDSVCATRSAAAALARK